MALKITCVKCSQKNILVEPLPLPGDQLACSSCSFRMTITYPPKVLEKLKTKGKVFRVPKGKEENNTKPPDSQEEKPVED